MLVDPADAEQAVPGTRARSISVSADHLGPGVAASAATTRDHYPDDAGQALLEAVRRP